MPTFAGHNSRIAVSFDGENGTYLPLPKLRSIDMPRNSEEIDASNNDSGGWEEKLNGRKSWGLSGEYLLIDVADTVQDALHTAWINETEVWVDMMPKVGSGLRKFRGKAVVGVLDISLGQSDPASVSFEFRSRGAVEALTQA